MPAAMPLTVTTSGKSLFSQYYLGSRLASHPEWGEDAQPAFDAVHALWQKAQQYGETWNEAQTEDEFVKPVLAALGWSYIPQVKNRRSGRVNRPDYALFADEAAKNAAYPYQGQDDAFYSRALAIAEAKYWGRPLSQKDSDGRDTWKAGNPSHQMVGYLVGTRSPWGILTNGQVWRLYSREVSSTASEYYEFDLSAIFPLAWEEREPGNEVEAFKRFWLFFRRAAFTPDSQGRSFIQRIHEGSATYASEISDKLKELVYDQVMPEIAAGFVAYRRQQLGVAAESEESLQQIYRASLSLLYKLLFVLYAEARSLLPIQSPAYWEESLTCMARDFAERIDRGQAISDATHATRQYDSLLALFRRIDQGDPSLGIPRYDGGLFNPAAPDNQFLAQHKLNDRAVAQAVDILVRDAGQPVDYAYISVRNLGSIYEGLLENRLVVEPRPLGSPQTPRVWLVNDKGERKATGSYYTPDYIVSYIVEQTLTPILDEREERFAAAMGRIAELRGKLQRTADAGAVGLLRRELQAAERQAREAFLGVTVCDPAMGSGHFLVNAVDFLTDGIIEHMHAYHDTHPAVLWEWNPIQRLIERVRRDILGEMERQGIALEAARLDDTALLTRLVMKRCIYGVDLNPMAVELAKLSLWLHSFTVGAPLSFLDHHLRWGDSLIGSDVRTVEAAMQGTTVTTKVSYEARRLAKGRGETAREASSGFQFGLYLGPFAGLLDLTTTMLQIAERADSTLADVRQSAEEFGRFQAELTPYKQVLDLWVSQHFGNKVAKEFLTLYGDQVLPALKGQQVVGEPHRSAIERARELWKAKRFFHWDLEFPEVFVDLARRDWAENPGFDAVIGNPPYVRAETADKAQRVYLIESGRYSKIWGRFDLYLPFLEGGIQLLRHGGTAGMIIPGAFLTINYAEKLREWILASWALVSILDLRDIRVFKEAAVSTCVPIIRKTLPDELHETIIWIGSDDCITIKGLVKQRVFISLPSSAIRPDISPNEMGIKAVIDSVSIAMGTLCYCITGLVGHDSKSGASIDRLIHTDQVDDTCKPYIEAKEWQGRYSTLEPQRFIEYKPELMHRPKFTELFESSKIVVQRIASGNLILATLDRQGIYVNHVLNCCTKLEDVIHLGSRRLHVDLTSVRPDSRYKISYILALVCSSLLGQYHNRYLSPGLDIFPDTLRQLPIRRITFTTPAADRARYAEKGRRLYEQFCAQADYACVLGFVEHHLLQGQSDVVHDLLAFLAEQMMAMNQEKQAETAGFLAWLEREIGAPIDALRNKTALRNYLGDYQKGEAHLALEDVLAVLRKNRRKLASDPSARAFQERLVAEYAASLATLLPIKQRLAATDRLIDQVVYRLYGLTAEEIAVVERK